GAEGTGPTPRSSVNATIMSRVSLSSVEGRQTARLLLRRRPLVFDRDSCGGPAAGGRLAPSCPGPAGRGGATGRFWSGGGHGCSWSVAGGGRGCGPVVVVCDGGVGVGGDARVGVHSDGCGEGRRLRRNGRGPELRVRHDRRPRADLRRVRRGRQAN